MTVDVSSGPRPVTGTAADSARRADAEASARRRLDAAIADVRAILREDLPAFAVARTKEVFLSHPERASAMSTSEVAALKQRCTQLGQDFAAVLDEALADVALWLQGRQVPREEREGLDSHPAVWGLLETYGAEVEGALAAAGFEPPDGGFGIVYRPPARFVGGRYLKTAMEAVWRALGELETLEDAHAEAQTLATRDELVRRWEQA